MVDCPLCRPSPADLRAERPWRWLAAPPVCGRHGAAARAPDGRRLAELAAGAAAPMTEPDLGLLFNPLSIDGGAAWGWWSPEGWGVVGARFPSEDGLEFAAQHRPEHVDVLYELHASRGLFQVLTGMEALARYTSGVGYHRLRALERLCALWWRQRGYRAALAGAGLRCPPSVDHALALVRDVAARDAPVARIMEPVGALLALAGRRFAALGRAGT